MMALFAENSGIGVFSSVGVRRMQTLFYKLRLPAVGALFWSGLDTALWAVRKASFLLGSLLLVGGELGLMALIQYDMDIEMVKSMGRFVHTLQSHVAHI